MMGVVARNTELPPQVVSLKQERLEMVGGKDDQRYLLLEQLGATNSREDLFVHLRLGDGTTRVGCLSVTDVIEALLTKMNDLYPEDKANAEKAKTPPAQ